MQSQQQKCKQITDALSAVVKSEQTAILKEICCLLHAMLENEKIAYK